MKLLFPDAYWTPNAVSGALFLYFHDEKLLFTLHPSVSTHLTGTDPFDFIRFVEEHSPDWLPKFERFISIWMKYRSSLHDTTKILEPLHGIGFNTALLSYPKDTNAWQRSKDIIMSSKLRRADINKIIDPVFSIGRAVCAHLFRKISGAISLRYQCGRASRPRS